MLDVGLIDVSFGCLVAALVIGLFRLDGARKLSAASQYRWVLIMAVLSGLSVICALVAGALPMDATTPLLTLLVYCSARERLKPKWLLVGDVILVLIAIVLSMHLVPGLPKMLIESDVLLSGGERSFDIAASYDKAFAGLLLLFLVPSKAEGEGSQGVELEGAGWGVTLIAMVVAIGLVLVVAFAVGVPWRPKWDQAVIAFFVVGLFSTCIAEEALFRGILQYRLQRSLDRISFIKSSHAGLFALVVVSIVFGAIHLPGGYFWAVVAGIAGFAYGGVYLLTGRLTASILAHIGVNIGHFLLFQYPLG